MSATTQRTRIELGGKGILGRASEQARLLGMLEQEGPGVLFLHGLAGIGKSSLVELVSAEVRRRGAVVIRLDTNLLEPTPAGFMGALAEAVGGDADTPREAMARLEGLGARVVLVVDPYELLRMIDYWVRLELVLALPANVKLFLAGREPPPAAWWQAVSHSIGFNQMELGPIDEEAALAVLAGDGVPAEAAKRLNRVTRGHPLALRVAAGAMHGSLDPGLEQAAADQVVEELTRLHVEGLDPLTRRCLESASVVRRSTRPLLEAMLPDTSPQDAYDRLAALPFVHATDDGLQLHESVQRALSASLRAADPDAHRRYRRAAYGQPRSSLRGAPQQDLWRYTADTLFLIDNPTVRNVFFPTNAHAYTGEQALPADAGGIMEIARLHTLPAVADELNAWWARLPSAFRVLRGSGGEIVGFYMLFEPSQATPSWMESDSVVSAYWRHLRANPTPRHQTSIFIRDMLSRESGGKPSPAQGALWLDAKRLYVELRPRLRRVYSMSAHWDMYAPALTTVGFRPLPGDPVVALGRTVQPVVLDFGPSSVDGWVSWLLSGELGVEDPELLDRRQHQLVLDGKRVDLTRQEFEVLQYMSERRDQVVTREELLGDVWGHAQARGSNVVDATVKQLRQKMGVRSNSIETLRGLGYRFRG